MVLRAPLVAEGSMGAVPADTPSLETATTAAAVVVVHPMYDKARRPSPIAWLWRAVVVAAAAIPPISAEWAVVAAECRAKTEPTAAPAVPKVVAGGPKPEVERAEPNLPVPVRGPRGPSGLGELGATGSATMAAVVVAAGTTAAAEVQATARMTLPMTQVAAVVVPDSAPQMSPTKPGFRPAMGP